MKTVLPQQDILRDKIVNRILKIALIFASLTVIISITRWIEIGWKPLFTIHILLVLTLLVLTIYRHYLPPGIKTHVIASVFAVAGILGLLNFGLQGGHHLAFITVALLAVLQKKQVAVSYAVLIFACYSVIGWGYAASKFSAVVDLNLYSHQLTPWLNYFTGLIMVFAIFIGGFGQFYLEQTKLVNEKVNLSAALQMKKDQLETVSDNLPNGYVYQLLINTELNKKEFLYISAGVTKVHHISPESVLSDPTIMYNRIQLEDRERLLKEEANAIENFSTFNMVVKCFPIKKREIYLLINSEPMKVSESEVLWNGICLDITDRRLAEQALTDNEEKYRTLFNSANDAIFLMKENIFVDCNAKTLEMFGCTREEIICNSPINYSPEKQPNGQLSSELAMEKINAAYEGFPQFFEWQHIKQNKQVFDAEVSLNRIRLKNESFLLAIVREVTERKKAELMIRENEEKLRNIFDNTQDAIFILDPQFKILTANKAFLAISGLAEKDLSSINVLDIMLNKRAEQIVTEHMHELFKGEDTSNEYLIRNDSGNIVPVEARGKTILYEGKEAILVSFTNISERKRLEKEVFSAGVRAEEKEKSRLAKDLHDGLGPLLSTCRIYLHRIKSEGLGEEKMVLRLEELINDALVGIKEISNNISPHILRNFGLIHAIESFASKLDDSIRVLLRNNLKTKDRLDDITEVTIYRTLTELINNTMKYAKASRIEIGFDETDNELTISYLDNGIGFEYRKVREESQGFGLLNMESRIKSIGGQYHYTSSPGKGVEVFITLRGDNH